MNSTHRLRLGAGVLLVAAFGTLGVSPVAAAPSDISPQSACSPGWYYRSISRGADTHSRVGPTQSDYNGTSTTAKMTLTATKSGTISTTVTGGGHVSLSVELVSIESQYSIDVQNSVSVTLGNSIQINVPAHKTGNGDYGAWRAYIKGVEEYYTATCAVTQTVAQTTYSPYRVGWRTWIS